MELRFELPESLKDNFIELAQALRLSPEGLAVIGIQRLVNIISVENIEVILEQWRDSLGLSEASRHRADGILYEYLYGVLCGMSERTVLNDLTDITSDTSWTAEA